MNLQAAAGPIQIRIKQYQLLLPKTLVRSFGTTRPGFQKEVSKRIKAWSIETYNF